MSMCTIHVLCNMISISLGTKNTVLYTKRIAKSSYKKNIFSLTAYYYILNNNI